MSCPNCGISACYDCGGCVEHCTCPEGYVECTCYYIDVDVMEARDCLAHGPRSTGYKEAHRREVEYEFGVTLPREENADCPF